MTEFHHFMRAAAALSPEDPLRALEVLWKGGKRADREPLAPETRHPPRGGTMVAALGRGGMGTGGEADDSRKPLEEWEDAADGDASAEDVRKELREIAGTLLEKYTALENEVEGDYRWRPPELALLGSGKLRAVAGLLTADRVPEGDYDIPKIVKTIAETTMIGPELPRELLTRNDRRLHLICDRNEGMVPFHRDQERLLDSLRQTLPDTERRNVSPGEKPSLRGIHAGSACLVVTDFSAGIARRGLSSPVRGAWKAFVEEASERGIAVSLLTPFGVDEIGTVAPWLEDILKSTQRIRVDQLRDDFDARSMDTDLSASSARAVRSEPRHDRLTREAKHLLWTILRVSSLDAQTLRATRIALSDPDRLIDRLDWGKMSAPQPRPGMRPIPLNAADEYDIWNLPIFDHRSEPWLLNRGKAESYLSGFDPYANDARRALIDFALDVQRRFRLHRSGAELADDTALQLDWNGTEEVRRAVDRLQGIRRRRRRGEGRGETRVETVVVAPTLTGDTLLLQAAATSKNRRFTLGTRNGECHLTLTLFRSGEADSGRSKTIRQTLPLRVTLGEMFPDDDAGADEIYSAEIVDHLRGNEFRRLSLSAAMPGPLLTFRPPKSETVRELYFRKGRITTSDRTIEAARMTAIEEEPRLPKTFAPNVLPETGVDGRRSPGGSTVVAALVGEQVVFAGEDGQPVSVTIDRDEEGHMLLSSNDGCLAVVGDHEAHHLRIDGDECLVTRIPLFIPSRKFLFIGAVGRRGIIVAAERGAHTDLYLLPVDPDLPDVSRQRDRPFRASSPVMVGSVEIEASEISGLSIDEDGFLALSVRHGVVVLHEPLQHVFDADRIVGKEGLSGRFGQAEASGDTSKGAAKPNFPIHRQISNEPIVPYGRDANSRRFVGLLLTDKITTSLLKEIGDFLKTGATVVEAHLRDRLPNRPKLVSALLALFNGRTPDRLRDTPAVRNEIGTRLPGSDFTLLMLAAVMPSSVALVRTLLDLGADPNVTDDFGRSPLQLSGFLMDGGETMRVLLAAGADPTIGGRMQGWNIGPLAAACFPQLAGTTDQQVPRDLLVELIERGADVNHRANSDGLTALIGAAMRNDKGLMERLLSKGAEVEAKQVNGLTALSAAAAMGSADAVALLLERGAAIEQDGIYDPFLSAVAHGQSRCAKLLLDAGANPSRLDLNGHNAFGSFIVGASGLQSDIGHADVRDLVALLLDAGLSPDSPESYFVPALVDIGKQADIRPARAQMILDALVELGRRISPIRSLRAISPPYLDTPGFARLLEAGQAGLWEVDGKGERGQTLLHLLAARGILPLPGASEEERGLFARALAAGADAGATDDDGACPLHYAVAGDKRDEDMIRALAAAAPDTLTQRTKDGLRPYDIARKHGPAPWIDTLKPESGADDEPGETAVARTIPSEIEFARLSLRADATAWTEHPLERAVERFFGTLFDRDVISVQKDRTWLPVMRRSTPLPYKEAHRLSEMWWRDEQGALGVSAKIVTEGGDDIALDGNSAHIHELNGNSTLALDTAQNALAYLVFFCAAVHGDEGPFTILLDPRHATLTQKADDEDRRQIKEKFREPKITRAEEAWEIDAIIQYGDDYFKAEFSIHPTGMVEMREDTALLTEMPILPFRNRGGIFYRGRNR